MDDRWWGRREGEWKPIREYSPKEISHREKLTCAVIDGPVMEGKVEKNRSKGEEDEEGKKIERETEKKDDKNEENDEKIFKSQGILAPSGRSYNFRNQLQCQ